MISFPKGCAELSTKYPASYTTYTVTQITVNLGAKRPCYVLTDCPVDVTVLRRLQRDLHRIGVRLTVEDILNWALLAGSSLDLYPIASTLIRLSAVEMSEFLPVVTNVLTELCRHIKPLFRGLGYDSRIIEYSDGTMVVEVKNVIDPKQLTHFTN